MAILSVQNVDEYKEKYAKQLEERSVELGKPITDEMLTEAIYKKLSDKADIDYFSFYKSFNPNGKFSNSETYRATLMTMNQTTLIL